MLVFKCWSCEHEFQVSLENLHNKISLQCYNCDNPLPKSTIKHLRDLSNAYMDVIDSLHYGNTFGNSWGICVKGTNDFIPNKKDALDFDAPSTDDSYWKARRKPFIPKDDDENLPF